MLNFNQFMRKEVTLSEDTFLKEDKEGKNLHLEHLEDEVLNGGVSGTRGAINFLQSLRDMLAGNSATRKVNLSSKWDGCVHEDTVILTNLGDMTIKQIVESPHLWSRLEIMGKDLERPLKPDVFTTFYEGVAKNGDKNWVEIELENGEKIKLTEDHEVHTSNRGWVKAGELTDCDDITQL
jgi:hypothetical protein